jgi:hypothetical protein
MPIWRRAIFGPARTTVPAACFLPQSAALACVFLGRWMLDVCPRFIEVGCSAF